MAKNKRRLSGTPALRAAAEAGLAHTPVEVRHSTHLKGGYALDTANTLDRDPASVFKTLMAEVDGRAVCAVIPANGMLNLKRLAKAAGGKHAEMMPPAKAERLTGYVTGGISPLGQRTAHPTLIDQSARDLATILVSGGKRGLSIEVAPGDLAAAVEAEFAPLVDVGRHG